MRSSVHDLLAEQAASRPLAPALSYRSVTHSYEQTWREARAAAGQLQDLGLARGERVAIYLEKRFETVAAGRMKPEEFDGFVRDTVNFLDYVGDPSQVQRRSIGIWVVLFLMVFTVFAWMLKKEYWKDIH